MLNPINSDINLFIFLNEKPFFPRLPDIVDILAIYFDCGDLHLRHFSQKPLSNLSYFLLNLNVNLNELSLLHLYNHYFLFHLLKII